VVFENNDAPAGLIIQVPETIGIDLGPGISPTALGHGKEEKKGNGRNLSQDHVSSGVQWVNILIFESI
jgi:hypothetical protein